MIKKWKLFLGICIIAAFFSCNLSQKPKLISSITTMDTAYLTILVNRLETKDVEQLESKILQMCKEDAFENIKLQTEDKPMAQNVHISVYASKADLENGSPFLIIKNDAGN